MRQAADVYTADLLDAPRRGRPRKPNAKTDAQRAREYRHKKRHEKSPVAVLFAREDSIYKSMTAIDVYDISRDARTFDGHTPVIAHPPCRAWGRLKAFAKPRHDEKDLALFAVRLVRRNGGVIEHPAHSSLWAAAALPKPGSPPDEFGGWTLEVPQYWFGHRAEKLTWLYIVGTTTPPLVKIKGGQPTHFVTTSKRYDQAGQRIKKGHPDWRPSMKTPEREKTSLEFAAWLVELARRCRPHQ